MDGVEWSDVGERIRECRLAAGLSQEELALRINLDRTMVAKIEAGHRRVDALELARLSEALGVPLDYFLRRHPQVLSRRASLVDAVASDAARQSQRLETVLLAWSYEIRQMMDLGVLGGDLAPMIYPHPADGVDSGRDAAMWLRDRLGLGLDPIETLMAVSEKAGQFVLVTELPGEGASLVDGSVAAAVVSREIDPGRRRATAAHELGHLVLGDEYSSAARSVAFVTNPSSRAYVSAYTDGRRLCRDFAERAAGNFTRLLTEQLTSADLLS